MIIIFLKRGVDYITQLQNYKFTVTQLQSLHPPIIKKVEKILGENQLR